MTLLDLIHREQTSPHNNPHRTYIPPFQFMEAHYLLITYIHHANLPSFVRFLIRAHRVSKQIFELVQSCVSLERVDSNFSFQDMS